jgi:hypothetical protein
VRTFALGTSKRFTMLGMSSSKRERLPGGWLPISLSANMRGRVALGFAGEQEVDVVMSASMLGAGLEVSSIQTGFLGYGRTTVTPGFMGENDVVASMSRMIPLGGSCLGSEGRRATETRREEDCTTALARGKAVLIMIVVVVFKCVVSVYGLDEVGFHGLSVWVCGTKL